MKNLIIAAFIVALACTSSIAGGIIARDNNSVPIQAFSPNGLNSALLTVTRVTYDMSSFMYFSVFSPADCKIRLMATSSLTGSIQEPILGAQWNIIVVNPATPFASISGCAGGNLRRQ